ncbi:hypothetical protein SAMN05877753_104188 [Bacillus oleivorans]|uniref:Uncharacterized protein n=1 Tax=Bacillus oleivorans TaxID=1448271 RepID=A0A285CT27_9BACI|nr:hypothetical protein [Bacillus oleivorans]SNX70575.1 hypothetical protein SAMN05877753_104188 [Bacillus oleivorans]
MHKLLIVLFFIIAAISIPSLASAQSNSLPAGIEEVETVTDQSHANTEEISQKFPLHEDDSFESLHKEANNVKDSVEGLKDAVLDSVDSAGQSEINLKVDNTIINLEISAARGKAEVKTSIKFRESDSNPPGANNNNSTNEIKDNHGQSNEIHGERQVLELTQPKSVKDTKNEIQTDFQQPTQESSHSLPNTEGPMLFFYEHPGVVGPQSGGFGSGHSANSDLNSSGAFYGFLQDQLRVFELKQSVLSGRVSFYFDQWLNAPPVQPPETSFFF